MPLHRHGRLCGQHVWPVRLRHPQLERHPQPRRQFLRYLELEEQPRSYHPHRRVRRRCPPDHYGRRSAHRYKRHDVHGHRRAGPQRCGADRSGWRGRCASSSRLSRFTQTLHMHAPEVRLGGFCLVRVQHYRAPGGSGREWCYPDPDRTSVRHGRCIVDGLVNRVTLAVQDFPVRARGGRRAHQFRRQMCSTSFPRFSILRFQSICLLFVPPSWPAP